MGEVLPGLLAERGVSMRALARGAGIPQSFLSRALRGLDYKTINGDHAARIAGALDLPEDYFREYRAAYVRERLLGDPDLVDSLYRRLRRRDR